MDSKEINLWVNMLSKQFMAPVKLHFNPRGTGRLVIDVYSSDHARSIFKQICTTPSKELT